MKKAGSSIQRMMYKKMISIIAHDIRRPIGSLKHFFELNEMNLIRDFMEKDGGKIAIGVGWVKGLLLFFIFLNSHYPAAIGKHQHPV